MFHILLYRLIPVNAIHFLSFIVILAIFVSEIKFRTHFKSGWQPLTLNFSSSFLSNTQANHLLFYWDQPQPPFRVKGASVQNASELSQDVFNMTRTSDINTTNQVSVESTQENMSKFANPSHPLQSLMNSEVNKVEIYQGLLRPPVVVDMHTDNTSRLSLALRRIVKKYSIKNVIDFSCQHGGHWIPSLVYALEYEVPRFQYRCIVPDRQSLNEMMMRFKQLENTKVIEDAQPWNTNFSQADMSLMWYVVGFYAPQATWRFISTLQNAQVRFAIIPNFPDLTHNVATGSPLGRVNVRRTPYRFTQPMQVVNNMSWDNSIPKQLLVYNLSRIRA